ncbi:MAG: hypothetical protein STSR0007_04110 [Thermovirga sp.]
MKDMAKDGIEEPKSRSGVKKIIRILRAVFLSVILLSGIIAGLAVGGGLYAIVDNVAPWVGKVPWVGSRGASFLLSLNHPLSSLERRAVEMEEKERHLLALIEDLEKEKSALDKSREDLAKSGEELEMKMQVPREAEGQGKTKEETPRSYGLISDSFENMSAAKAAKIVTLLSISEAAELLGSLDTEQRGEILGKMPPEAAAKLLKFARQDHAASGSGDNQAGAVGMANDR